MSFHAQLPTTLGPLLMQADSRVLTGLYFLGQADCPIVPGLSSSEAPIRGPSAGEYAGRPLKSLRAHRASGAGQLPGMTPTRPLRITGRPQAVESVPSAAQAIFEQTAEELSEYFAGKRRQFDVPLGFEGTAFQKRVWAALLTIPFGSITSYGRMAADAGLGEKHGRAVGTAVGRNPICIIVPCHRVLASSGRLNGYTGGLDRKLALLELEGYTLS